MRKLTLDVFFPPETWMLKCLSRAYSPASPHVKESKTVLDSGSQAEDYGFVVSETWITDYSR